MTQALALDRRSAATLAVLRACVIDFAPLLERHPDPARLRSALAAPPRPLRELLEEGVMHRDGEAPHRSAASEGTTARSPLQLLALGLHRSWREQWRAARTGAPAPWGRIVDLEAQRIGELCSALGRELLRGLLRQMQDESDPERRRTLRAELPVSLATELLVDPGPPTGPRPSLDTWLPVLREVLAQRPIERCDHYLGRAVLRSASLDLSESWLDEARCSAASNIFALLETSPDAHADERERACAQALLERVLPSRSRRHGASSQ
jgi:hypothetical protein